MFRRHLIFGQRGIDYSIIADNAAGHFMKNKDINLAIEAAENISGMLKTLAEKKDESLGKLDDYP